MTEAREFAAGGFRYIPGPFQYSGGAAALPGLAIERVRFRKPPPLADGFAAVEAWLRARGRPLEAFCACELRIPAPFDEDGFAAFNRAYAGTLERWGLLAGGGNPVARSNVCPARDPPAEPVFWAFSHTVAEAGAGPSFVIAGSAESPEGRASYAEGTIRPGETSAAALRDKARFVLGELERRLAALGAGWAETTAAQLYTVHDVHPVLTGEIAARGAARAGVTWHYARPPVEGLEFEMDTRGVAVERLL